MACSSNNATKRNPDLSLSHLCKLRERDDLRQQLEEYSAEEILSRGPCVPAHMLEVTSLQHKLYLKPRFKEYYIKCK